MGIECPWIWRGLCVCELKKQHISHAEAGVERDRHFIGALERLSLGSSEDDEHRHTHTQTQQQGVPSCVSFGWAGRARHLCARHLLLSSRTHPKVQVFVVFRVMSLPIVIANQVLLFTTC